MKKNFTDFDYDCVYGLNNEPITSHACYGEVFQKLTKSNNSFTLRQLISVRLVPYKSNYCLLNLKQITYYLKYLANIVPFTWDIQKDLNINNIADRDIRKRYEKDYYIVTLKVENLTILQVKFLLTMFRKLYEFPYNIHLKDMFSLRKEKWNNLLPYEILILQEYTLAGSSSVHTILPLWGNRIVEKISLRKVRNILKKSAYDMVHAIHPQSDTEFKLYHNELLRGSSVCTYDDNTKETELYLSYEQRKKAYEFIYKKIYQNEEK